MPRAPSFRLSSGERVGNLQPQSTPFIRSAGRRGGRVEGPAFVLRRAASGSQNNWVLSPEGMLPHGNDSLSERDRGIPECQSLADSRSRRGFPPRMRNWKSGSPPAHLGAPGLVFETWETKPSAP